MKRPISVIMTVLGVLILSFIAIQEIPVSLVPNTQVPKLIVRIENPQASAVDIEKEVLLSLRTQLASLDYLKEMQSTSYDHYGIMTLYFDYGAPMGDLFVELQKKIDQWMPSKPVGYRRPVVLMAQSTDIPIVKLQVEAPKLTSEGLYHLVSLVFKKNIESVDGISYVDFSGITPQGISIMLDSEKLDRYHVSAAQCRNRLLQENIQMGSLQVEEGRYVYQLQLEREEQDPMSRISSIQLCLPRGDLLPLTDFCTLSYQEDSHAGFHLFNGSKAVVLNIHRQKHARVMEVMEDLKKVREDLEKSYPDVHLSFTQDQTNLLKESISSLETSLFFGGLFAFFLLFLFLGRSFLPVIMAAVIPISLMITMGVFYLLDISINIISIGGISLGIGMLIDNAIIVMDNIHAHHKGAKDMHLQSCFEACVKATSEVVGPLISSVLTTLAVFIPLVYLSGIAGFLFLQQAMALTATLVASLLVSFFLVPLLYFLLFKYRLKKGKAMGGNNTRLYTKVEAIFGKMHRWVVLHDKRLIVGGLVWVLLGMIPFYFISRQPLPKLTEHTYVLTVDWNQRVAKEQYLYDTKALEKVLSPFASIVESNVGTTTFQHAKQYVPMNHSEITVVLKEASMEPLVMASIMEYMNQHHQDDSWHWSALENSLTQLVDSEKKAFVDLRFRSKDLLRKTFSLDQLNSLRVFAKQHQLGVAQSANILPSLSLTLDRKQILYHGISEVALISKIKRMLGNHRVMEYYFDGQQVSIFLQERIEGLHTFLQQTMDGIPLSKLILINRAYSTASIVSDREGMFVSLYSDDEQMNVDELLDDLSEDKHINELFTITPKGSFLSYKKEQRHLIKVILLALLVLYFILSAQFESFVQPLIVLITLPLGLVGSFWCLWLSGQTLNVMAFIGLIVMLGVTVNDAILKIDTINTRRDQYPDIALDDIVDQACELRLKPILMTTFTTVLALFPILIGSGLGNELQQPLAWAVIGGLSIGTFMAIFWIPILYLKMDKLVNRRRVK